MQTKCSKYCADLKEIFWDFLSQLFGSLSLIKSPNFHKSSRKIHNSVCYKSEDKMTVMKYDGDNGLH